MLVIMLDLSLEFKSIQKIIKDKIVKFKIEMSGALLHRLESNTTYRVFFIKSLYCRVDYISLNYK